MGSTTPISAYRWVPLPPWVNSCGSFCIVYLLISAFCELHFQLFQTLAVLSRGVARWILSPRPLNPITKTCSAWAAARRKKKDIQWISRNLLIQADTLCCHQNLLNQRISRNLLIQADTLCCHQNLFNQRISRNLLIQADTLCIHQNLFKSLDESNLKTF